MSQVISNIFRFVFLLFLQLVLVNNIQISGALIYPQIYILIILLLPFSLSTWVSIIIAFFTGLLIDLGTNTFGLHAFACCTMAFVRPAVLNFLSPRDGYDVNSEPSLNDQGVGWFMIYGSILILIHHFCLFMIEKYSWMNFLHSMSKILLSGLLTLVLALLYQFIVKRIRLR